MPVAWLADRLRQQFGVRRVFRDVDSLSGGAYYNVDIRRAAERCRVMLVIISDRWAEVTNEHGSRRLFEPNDWVREEIQTAIRLKTRLIPILVNDTVLPGATDVPEEIRPLLGCQTRRLRHDSMPADMDRLIRDISQDVPRYRRRRRIGAASAIVMVIICGLILLVKFKTGQSFHREKVLSNADAVRYDIVPVGKDPWSIALDSASVWVANSVDGTVSRIDRNSRRVTDTIPVGRNPLGITIDDQGGVWVANNADNTVTRIDAQTRKPTATVAVNMSPGEIVSTKGAVWVAEAGAGQVGRIDLSNGFRVSQIPVGPEPVVLATDDKNLWVGDAKQNMISQIDIATASVTDVLHPGRGTLGITANGGTVYATNPSDNGDNDRIVRLVTGAQSSQDTVDATGLVTGIAVDRDSIWVTASNPGTLTRYDARTMQKRGSVKVGNGPAHVAVAGDEIWVTNRGDGTAIRLSRSDFVKTHFDSNHDAIATIATTKTGNAPTGVAGGFDSVWVTNSDDGTVTRFDTNEVAMAVIPVGGSPHTVTIGGGFVWVVSDDSHEVFKIDPTTNSIVQKAPTHPAVEGAVFAQGSLWLASGQDNVVTRVDPNSLATLTTIPVGRQPLRIATDGTSIWTANGGDSSISQVDSKTNNVVSTVKVPGHTGGGLASDGGGLWASLYDSNTISRIDPGVRRVTASVQVGRGPLGVTSGEGSIWTVSSKDDSMDRIDPKGPNRSAVFSVGGFPQTIVDYAGAVWITCTGENALVRVQIS